MLQGTNKYLNDLFYVGPLYHQIFANLDKLIFLDVGKISSFFLGSFPFCSDLEFYRDVKLLYKQFSQFDDQQLIGVIFHLQLYSPSDNVASRRYINTRNQMCCQK